MLTIFKSLFMKNKEYVPDPPGRTFKQLLIGRYFGCEDINASKTQIAKAKQSKIDKIAELELLPMFIKYIYKNTTTTEVSSVHVTFQKEVFSKKWNMTHVTDISFIVHSADLDEFEAMSGLKLDEDFRDLSSSDTSNVIERRKEKRAV